MFALWRKMEPRTLSDAVSRFLHRNHEGAHNAGDDAAATADLLPAMATHFGLDVDIDKLAELTKPTIKIDGVECAPIDLAGVLARRPDGVAVYTHKKVRGVPFADDLGYASWILRTDFSANTHGEVERELAAIAEREAAQRALKEQESSDDIPF